MPRAGADLSAGRAGDWGRLTRRFSGFLRRRRTRRHFGRHPLVDAFAGHGPAGAAGAELTRSLLLVAHDTPAGALARLESHADGLSVREAAARLAHAGVNDVEHDRPVSWWVHLWHCYKDPFNLLLTVLATVSYLSADRRATVVIGVMVGLSTLIRFAQEGRSRRAVEHLVALVGNTALVIRRGAATKGDPAIHAASRQLEIPIRKVVHGDLVVLAAGDMVPADCRVLVAKDLFVAQAALTGESLPVEKHAERLVDTDEPLAQSNLAFMGTNVVSGSATVVVVATGRRTYFGALASRVVATEAEPNAFQAGVNSVSWLLIRFGLVMVPIVLLINGLTKGDWLQAALFALSVAVGLTPEMLPMVVTSTLAKGAVMLSRRKVVVKRLDAIQSLGAMDVLCTDKTGTLTQDQVALARSTDAFGNPSDDVLNFAFLNSHYQTGLKNLLDRAVLAHVELPAELKLTQDYRKVDEIPFDFERRRMSVVVSERDEQHELICKGAVEEVLAACTRVRTGSGSTAQDGALDPPVLARLKHVTQGLNQEGLRVIAVAVKHLPPDQTVYSVADEGGLTLIGYVAFLDPPKDSAAPALQALASHGVQVKVLSGDNEFVTASVARQVGLVGSEAAGDVLLGAQIEPMSEGELAGAVERHRLFAKLAPLHKERVVRALRRNGHVVGFIGDGINDAPALRAADVGISVHTAVDIAKEAADIILLEKSLMVLDEGVIEGRRTFCNMLKYIRMTASSNFGNVFSVLVASAFLPFLPMLPLQLLTQNLLYDIAQTGIPFDHVDPELVDKPIAWDPRGIGRFMLFFGPVSSLFDLATFALMWWVFAADSVANQALFQSGWFVVGLLTQTLVVHMLRTPKLPFVQSRAATPLTLTTLAIVAVGIFLPMGPLAGYFKFVPLPGAYFGWLAAMLLAYGALATAMKRFYLRRHGWQ
ncbi:magnesium-translocating P-type ATPase [Rhizobacter sp. Root404]|uniref:magnesium-translocating P-type ATPase n=1 Tax=Rhizobacter sp. Root404 TaxID=1736528 RepID=UPI0009E6B200|nr:magnesium-translocating P-type ATPase [Rhizobacter sp. Root404]